MSKTLHAPYQFSRSPLYFFKLQCVLSMDWCPELNCIFQMRPHQSFVKWKKLKAMSGEDSGKDIPTNECPVCYERLQNPNISERRLSCGHSFCHDCLVKYLMTAKKVGSIKKNIICPLCRYVTFLSKRGLILPPNAGQLNQILEVPHSPSCLTHSTVVGNPNTLVIPIPETTGSHSPQDLCRCTCSGDASPDLIGHSCGSQVFIISDQGQPMESSDEVVTSNETHHIDARANCCRSPSLIMILLVIFLVAVLAAVLPWILLVKKNMKTRLPSFKSLALPSVKENI